MVYAKVYAKAPFAGPEQVLDYVGRYTHRVAISNNRLLDIEQGQVSFRWKDYRQDSTRKTMTLSADEFIRRFLLHVLPDGYRREKLAQCRQLLGMRAAPPRHRIGWRIVRTSGSHRTLRREGWPQYRFAYHDKAELGPVILSEIGKHTGPRPEDLQCVSSWQAAWAVPHVTAPRNGPALAAAVHGDGVLVGETGTIRGAATRPEKADDSIAIFGTGYVPANPSAPNGGAIDCGLVGHF